MVAGAAGSRWSSAFRRSAASQTTVRLVGRPDARHRRHPLNSDPAGNSARHLRHRRPAGRGMLAAFQLASGDDCIPVPCRGRGSRPASSPDAGTTLSNLIVPLSAYCSATLGCAWLWESNWMWPHAWVRLTLASPALMALGDAEPPSWIALARTNAS